MTTKSTTRRDHSVTEIGEIKKCMWRHNPEHTEWMKRVRKAEKEVS